MPTANRFLMTAFYAGLCFFLSIACIYLYSASYEALARAGKVSAEVGPFALGFVLLLFYGSLTLHFAGYAALGRKFGSRAVQWSGGAHVVLLALIGIAVMLSYLNPSEVMASFLDARLSALGGLDIIVLFILTISTALITKHTGYAALGPLGFWVVWMILLVLNVPLWSWPGIPVLFYALFVVAGTPLFYIAAKR